MILLRPFFLFSYMELQGGYLFPDENMKYFELLNRDAFLIGKGVLGSSSALRK